MLSNQLTETKQTFATHKKEYEIELIRPNDLAPQQIILQQKTADTLAHSSGAVVSLAKSSERAREKVCKVSKKWAKFNLKYEQGDWAAEGRSVLAKKVVDQMRSNIAGAGDANLQLERDYEEQLAVQKGRTKSPQALVTDLTDQVLRAKELYPTSSSKQRTASVEVNTGRTGT